MGDSFMLWLISDMIYVAYLQQSINPLNNTDLFLSFINLIQQITLSQNKVIIGICASLNNFEKYQNILTTFHVKKVQQFSIEWKGYVPESGARDGQFQTWNNEPLDNELLYSQWEMGVSTDLNSKMGTVPFEFQKRNGAESFSG